jgi:hypothetical protein
MNWMWWLTTAAGVLASAASGVAGSNLPEEVRAPAAALAMVFTTVLGGSHPGKSGR